MRIQNYPLIDAEDASTNISTSAQDISSMFAASAQVVSAATQLGSFKLQYSNDPTTDASFVSNWSDISGSTIAVNGAAVQSIPKFDVCYSWIRGVYTATSGTGVLTVNIKMNGY